MMKYLCLVIFFLLSILYFVIFQLWIPQKYENQNLNRKIVDLYSEIEVFNRINKEYSIEINNFRKQVKTNEKYNDWAKTIVPDDMLLLLQK